MAMQRPVVVLALNRLDADEEPKAGGMQRGRAAAPLIARRLNREHVESLHGAGWGASTIYGNRARGTLTMAKQDRTTQDTLDNGAIA